MSDYTPRYEARRELSRFMCQELLYDYVTGHLDEQRSQAVKDYLQKDPDLKREADAIKEAIEYCDELSKTTLSEPLKQRMSARFSWIQQFKIMLRIAKWPAMLKFAMEGLAVSLVVGALAIFMPWNQIKQKFVSRGTSKAVLIDENQQVIELENSKPENSDDSQIVVSDVSDTQSNSLSEPQKLEIRREQEESEKTNAEPSKSQPAGAVVAGSDNTKTNFDDDGTGEELYTESEVASDQPTAEVEDDKKKTLIKKSNGRNAFLFRGVMEASDLDVITPQLVTKIKSLGGRKGGKVEIGWRKPNASYFHFIIGEEHYDELIQFFENYGELKIRKTPHRRVMKENLVRLIIEVKNKEMTP